MFQKHIFVWGHDGGNPSVFLTGIPYSEHSSFLELKRFVQWLQPLKIIPTVNNGSWASSKALEKCFSEWLMETKTKPQLIYRSTLQLNLKFPLLLVW
ncbi:hypothetical protein VZT92_001962 [Zoarces viviparus]